MLRVAPQSPECTTMVLACLNPGFEQFGETKNVLAYVSRATKVDRGAILMSTEEEEEKDAVNQALNTLRTLHTLCREEEKEEEAVNRAFAQRIRPAIA